MTARISWTTWLTSAFGAGIVAMAIAAGLRATPVHFKESALPVDGQLTRQFESHYDAVFPARTLGVNVWGAIDYLFFAEGRTGVVVGRHDWLYTSEEFAAPPGAEQRVAAHLVRVKQVREVLAQRGTGLIVALLPAKARVYSEHLGGHAPDAMHAMLYDHVQSELRAQGIVAPDLLGAMLLCKHHDSVFLHTDTHWTAAGARCSATQLAQAAQGAGLATRTPTRYATQVESTESHRGDLTKFLALEPWFEALLPDLETIPLSRTAPTTASAGALLDDAPAPEVVLVGTSYSANPRWNFAGALQQTLGEEVANFAAEAEGPFTPMREYLRSAGFAARPPRLVIWEMPERYFPMEDGTRAASASSGERT